MVSFGQGCEGEPLTVAEVLAEAVRESGGFVSVNLLVFPGVTDLESDIEATIAALRRMGADLIQMRNLNMDPDLYLRVVGRSDGARPVGLIEAMRRLREAIPTLRFGYFNPPVRTLVRRRRAGRRPGHSPGMQ